MWRLAQQYLKYCFIMAQFSDIHFHCKILTYVFKSYKIYAVPVEAFDYHSSIIFTEELPVFGVPLSLAVERCPSHDGVQLPVIVRECIDHVEEHGKCCCIDKHCLYPEALLHYLYPRNTVFLLGIRSTRLRQTHRYHILLIFKESVL